MKKNWMWLVAVAALCGSLVAACGPKGDGQASGGGEASALASAVESAVPLSPAQEAKASMDASIAALREGRLDAIYNMLPESYQADVSNIVKAYASKIDRGLYEKAAGVLVAFGDAVAAQAPNLLELLNSDPDMGLDDVELPGGTGLDSLTADHIRDAGRWIADIARTVSYDDLASGNIAPLLSNPLTAGLVSEGIKQAPSDLISCAISEDTGEPLGDGIVSLRLTSHADADEEPESEDVQFVKVEGKWVPLEMMQGWGDAIQQALSAAGSFEIDDNARKTAENIMPVVQRSLESLKSAQTAQELKAQAMGAFMTIAMMGQM